MNDETGHSRFGERVWIAESVTYAAHVLKRTLSEGAANAACARLWKNTASLVRRARSRDGLYPPPIAPLDERSTRSGAVYLLPGPSVLTSLGAEPPESDSGPGETLARVLPLLTALASVLGRDEVWLTDDPGAAWIVRPEGVREGVRLVPGPTLVADEDLGTAVGLGAFTERPGGSRDVWNDRSFARFTANLLPAVMGIGEVEEDLVRRLQELAERGAVPGTVLAEVREEARRRDATGIRALPQFLFRCLDCGLAWRRIESRCPACGGASRIGGIRVFRDGLCRHPVLGLQSWAEIPLKSAPRPDLPAWNGRLAESGARFRIAGFTGPVRGAGAQSRRLIILTTFEGLWRSEFDGELEALKRDPPTVAPEEPPLVVLPSAPEPSEPPRVGPVPSPEPESPPLPPPEPSPPPPPPRPCRRCGADVHHPRQFCPDCGAEVTEAPVAVEAKGERSVGEFGFQVRSILERAGPATRELVEVAPGNSGVHQCLTAPSTGGLARLVASSGPLVRCGAFDALLAQEDDASEIRVLVTASEPGFVPFARWLRATAGEPGRYERVRRVLLLILEALTPLHSQGFTHAGLTPDRIRVASDAASIRLDWPIGPLPIGAAAAGTGGDSRYICPEFGTAGAAVAPSWDLHALGASMFWSLSDVTAAGWLSESGTSLPNLRVFVPDLPPGWPPLLEWLLAKVPSKRAPDAASVADRLGSLAPTEGSLPDRAVCAAGLTTGTAKRLLNPRNQDRCILSAAEPEGSPGSLLGDVSEEEFVTEDLEARLPVIAGVTDGVSSVQSGELAAQWIAEGVVDASLQVRDAEAPPSEFLMSVADAVNARLGERLAAAVAGGGVDALLDPDLSPSATLCAVLVLPASVGLVGVGDSRVYLLRAGHIETLTVDGDGLTDGLRGGLAPHVAAAAEGSRSITGWIGRFEEETVAGCRRVLPRSPRRVSDEAGICSLAFRPAPGDVLCCCSDGLSDYVDEGRIDLAGTLARCGPSEACRSLAAAADACGGKDNISVVVVRLAGSDHAKEEEEPCPTSSN